MVIEGQTSLVVEAWLYKELRNITILSSYAYSYMNNVKCIVQYKELRNITIVYAVRMCLVMSGVQISCYIASFGDRDIHLAIDATDSGDCPTDSKYSTCA